MRDRFFGSQRPTGVEKDPYNRDADLEVIAL